MRNKGMFQVHTRNYGAKEKRNRKIEVSISTESNEILVTGYNADNFISIHGTNFSLNLPIKIAEILVVDLQEQILYLKRFNLAAEAARKYKL